MPVGMMDVAGDACWAWLRVLGQEGGLGGSGWGRAGGGGGCGASGLGWVGCWLTVAGWYVARVELGWIEVGGGGWGNGGGC